ncbi:MAG TPA: hypothetical protein VF942_09590, partial [Acidimicrobiales bacterium]
AGAMVLKEMVAPWLGWTGLAVAAYLFVTGALGIFATKGALVDGGTASFIALIAFGLWVLAAGVAMVQQPEAARETAVKPIFAAH